MNIKKVIVFLCIGIFMSLSSASGNDIGKINNLKTYKIGSYQVPLFVLDKDSGGFTEVFKEAARRAGIKYEIILLPTIRTIKGFYEGELDGFFPAFDRTAGDKAAKSESIYVKRNIIFVRKGEPLIEEISQLERKRVGLTEGYTYDSSLTTNPKIKVDYAPSDILNLKKLSNGRIDAFVADENSGLVALKNSNEKNIIYNTNKNFFLKNVFIAFHGNDEGRMLADKISIAIREMKKDGTYDRIMGKIK